MLCHAGKHLLLLQLLLFFLGLCVLVLLVMWACGSLYVQMFESQVQQGDLQERHCRFFSLDMFTHVQLGMHDLDLMSSHHYFADCCSGWWIFCFGGCRNGSPWCCHSLCHLLCLVGSRFTRCHEGY